jgi:hypothetical protein
MARSSYIYVLFEVDDDIVGTFTVKYEMINYIERHPDVKFDARRYRDGQPDASWSVVDL